MGIVKMGPLVKAFSHKTSFLSRNRVTRIFLDMNNPLTTNEILLWIGRNKLSNSMLDKSIELIRHCLSLFINIQFLWNTSRFDKRIGWNIDRAGVDEWDLEEGELKGSQEVIINGRWTWVICRWQKEMN